MTTKRWFPFVLSDECPPAFIKQEVQRTFNIADCHVQLENNTLWLHVEAELSSQIQALIDALAGDSMSPQGLMHNEEESNPQLQTRDNRLDLPMSRRKFVQNVSIGFAASVTASKLTPFHAAAQTSTPVTNGFVGEWKTTYDTMTLRQDSNKLIKGRYQDGKRVVGVVRGKILAGYWYREDIDTPPDFTSDKLAKNKRDWGPFLFILNDGSFAGYWAYADFSEGKAWNGVLSNSNQEPPNGVQVATSISHSVVYNSSEGRSLKLFWTGVESTHSFVGTSDLGSVLLIQLGEHIGGVWLYPNNTNGVVAFEHSDAGHSGRWSEVKDTGRSGDWNLPSATLTTAVSPYAYDASGNGFKRTALATATTKVGRKWVKGDLHSHVKNYTGTIEDRPGTGGRADHAEVMKGLKNKGYSFTGLTGHECMPGVPSNSAGRNSPDISGVIPNGFTVLKTLENQVVATSPNWLTSTGSYALRDHWRATTGNLHRLYVNGGTDSFWACHPNYYDGAPNTIGQIKQAMAGGQKVRGVEVYNRYGEDRCLADVESPSPKAADPFGANFWDQLLADSSAS